jgi:hypothetical protein
MGRNARIRLQEYPPNLREGRHRGYIIKEGVEMMRARNDVDLGWGRNVLYNKGGH